MSLTFTRTTLTYNEATDTNTEVDTTITGSAIQVKGDPQKYRDLGLVLSTMPTLLFAADTYGDAVEPGDVVTWPETGGSAYTVKDVDPVAPDGVYIVARVIIGK